MIHYHLIACLLILAVSGQDISGKNIRPRPYYVSDISEEGPLQVYKSSRRSERYETENKPDIEYAYPARYETEQAEYALQRNAKDYEQLIKSQYAQLRQPNVEQYLKEVTPTTKTVYNQRPESYRLNAQSNGIKNREQTNTGRPPVRYVLQNEQRQPSQPQYQFQNPDQVKQYELQGPSSNVVYQNLPRVEESAEEPSKSQIYVSQSIAKKPTKLKQLKPKPYEQQQQPNGEYYRQLQIYHQQRQQQLEQLQQIQQNKPRDFEPSQLISYETPQGQKVEYQEETPSYPDPSPVRQQSKRPNGPIRYQLEQPQYESPEQVEYQRPTEYQQKPKQHPKYLPEPKTRYQTSPIEESSPPEEALAKYQASIKKYHQAQSPRYQPQEISYQPQPSKYQYSEESQPVPQYKDFDGVVYERPQSIRSRPDTRYKQYLQGPNVRYVERPSGLSYSLSK
ncbi:unnamed protein product [Brassicogethes aeneus]|uniref:Uncharacterized protein n=1 Tax=Brassicogethes aeneus TaxID=1431903 RepID=A0A9P0BFQ4_BRAAE|nr:unnamed protein product [Brassicogethes aeneus]